MGLYSKVLNLQIRSLPGIASGRKEKKSWRWDTLGSGDLKEFEKILLYLKWKKGF
jgi:hypothetical protein